MERTNMPAYYPATLSLSQLAGHALSQINPLSKEPERTAVRASFVALDCKQFVADNKDIDQIAVATSTNWRSGCCSAICMKHGISIVSC